MKVFKLFFTLMIIFTGINFIEAKIVVSNGDQAKLTLLNDYNYQIDFYESSKFLDSENKIDTLSYTIKLPIGVLAEDVTYNIAPGYKIVEEKKFDSTLVLNTYGFIVLKIQKENLEEGKSILTENKEKVFSITIDGNTEYSSCSMFNIVLEKGIDDKNSNAMIASIFIEKNLTTLKDSFVMGFDNKLRKTAGIYFDVNSEYIKIPISVYADTCMTSVNNKILFPYNLIEGQVIFSDSLTLVDVKEISPLISDAFVNKESGYFSIEYKNNQDVESYNGQKDLILKFKRSDVTDNDVSLVNMSITNFKYNNIEYSGDIVEALLIPGILGDWNLDGNISLADLLSVRQYVIGNTSKFTLTGLEDTNDDDKISLVDVIWLRKKLVGLSIN
ncbi:MAG: hypothetical protein IJA94_00805 [Bacilli bacterium]|nr:hypothetical protein [Bacilli bacterium]